MNMFSCVWKLSFLLVCFVAINRIEAGADTEEEESERVLPSPFEQTEQPLSGEDLDRVEFETSKEFLEYAKINSDADEIYYDDVSEGNEIDRTRHKDETAVVEGTIPESSAFHSGQPDTTAEAETETDVTIKATEANWNFLQDNIVLERNLLNDLHSFSEYSNKRDDITAEEDLLAKEIYSKASKIADNKLNRRMALDLFLEAADLGYTPAKEKVHWAQLLGSGTSVDLSSAREGFEHLALEGNEQAQTALGFMYAAGLGGLRPSPAKALIHYTFAAVGGSALAQMALAYRHWSGVGVTASCEKALEFYRKVAAIVANEALLSSANSPQKIRLLDEADNLGQVPGTVDVDLINYYQLQAEKGDVKAQLTLGQLHYQGLGVHHDNQRALNYFLRAADAGDAHAMAFLGKMYLEGSDAVPQDNATAFRYFKAAAEKSNPIGQAGLGLMYLHGGYVQKDYSKAFQYFTLAADKGWVDGHLHLGNMYLSGLGVKRDYKLAVKYLNMASQVGNTLAIYQLAQMHAAGTGMLRSCHTAVELYKNVAERGSWTDTIAEAYDDHKEARYAEALVKYMFMAELGYEVAQSNAAYILEQHEISFIEASETEVRALQYWNRAASQGYAAARVKLGDYYYYGRGTSVDFHTAAMHYRIASDQLHSAQAMFNLAYMHEQGLGMKQDVHLAKRFYDMAAETSIDAKVPVALALTKLAVLFGFSYLMSNESFLVGSFPLNPVLILGPNWDLYLITALLALLVLVIYLRRPQP